jgi:hypothetical protein
VPRFELAAFWERSEVRLDSGAFSINLIRLDGGWHPSPRLSLVTKSQYDTVSGLLGLQSRMRLIAQPGNEVFLVFTHNWQEDLGKDARFVDRVSTLNRGVQAKLNYAVRF